MKLGAVNTHSFKCKVNSIQKQNNANLSNSIAFQNQKSNFGLYNINSRYGISFGNNEEAGNVDQSVLEQLLKQNALLNQQLQAMQEQLNALQESNQQNVTPFNLDDFAKKVYENMGMGIIYDDFGHRYIDTEGHVCGSPKPSPEDIEFAEDFLKKEGIEISSKDENGFLTIDRYVSPKNPGEGVENRVFRCIKGIVGDFRPGKNLTNTGALEYVGGKALIGVPMECNPNSMVMPNVKYLCYLQVSCDTDFSAPKLMYIAGGANFSPVCWMADEYDNSIYCPKLVAVGGDLNLEKHNGIINLDNLRYARNINCCHAHPPKGFPSLTDVVGYVFIGGKNQRLINEMCEKGVNVKSLSKPSSYRKMHENKFEYYSTHNNEWESSIERISTFQTYRPEDLKKGVYSELRKVVKQSRRP